MEILTASSRTSRDSADSGWPRVLRRFAAEAWRRADTGELTDNELYCYQPCKARLRRARETVEVVKV